MLIDSKSAISTDNVLRTSQKGLQYSVMGKERRSCAAFKRRGFVPTGEPGEPCTARDWMAYLKLPQLSDYHCSRNLIMVLLSWKRQAFGLRLQKFSSFLLNHTGLISNMRGTEEKNENYCNSRQNVLMPWRKTDTYKKERVWNGDLYRRIVWFAGRVHSWRKVLSSASEGWVSSLLTLSAQQLACTRTNHCYTIARLFFNQDSAWRSIKSQL